MESSSCEVFAAGGLILALFIAAYFFWCRYQQLVKGRRTPQPGITLQSSSKAEQRERATGVLRQANSPNHLRWGEHTATDRREARRTYQAALDAIADAEGDYGKLAPIVDELLTLPIALAISG